jgi:hypothetical protein
MIGGYQLSGVSRRNSLTIMRHVFDSELGPKGRGGLIPERLFGSGLAGLGANNQSDGAYHMHPGRVTVFKLQGGSAF